MIKGSSLSKGTKFNLPGYRLQILKSGQLLKRNEERRNQDFH